MPGEILGRGTAGPHTGAPASGSGAHYHSRVRMRGGAIVLSVALAGGCAHPPGGFNSPEPASRVAAISRADVKRDMSAIPHLIESLLNDDPLVRLTAIRTLEDLTGETMGSQYWAPDAERERAARAWADWYEARQGRSRGDSPPSSSAAQADREGDEPR